MGQCRFAPDRFQYVGLTLVKPVAAKPASPSHAARIIKQG
jgi:hypothetical protein